MNHSLHSICHYLVIATLLTLFSTFSLAQDIIIEIEDARIDKPIANNPANGFMHIINFSENKTIVLQGASSSLAKHIQLHPNKPVEIEPGSAINFVYDEQYFRIQPINTSLSEGMTIPVTLHFEHGDENIDMIVVKPGTHIHHDENGGVLSHENH